ncbi:hypothetical protein MSP8887_03301 [Marinomonas spartinae]|uniref:DUF2239 domain-containing protein n=1 Tax=Marinomonas spartinae TaxID=1792290 RepID=A0A1A8TMU9_9GAMM|nr:DUF2239 family protein [Marinomonas spartinae]SBS35067.1 hypothetical protein MSP8886_03254 [Marinomonas spartinae]SBS38430.1 hypothetical protein MSP8887_03301 [Marinomonas spartinae]
MSAQYLAIYDKKIVARGTLEEIVHQVKRLGGNIEPMVFKEENCQRVDFSWYGDTTTVLKNLSSNKEQTGKRGRPKLGVKAKEVTLLPRHWEWLSAQKGGASAALRRLVDEAQRKATIEDRVAIKQQQLDKFMLAFLADEPGFEEASRALYRNSKVSFETAIDSWPDDVKAFLMDKFLHIADLHNGRYPS